MAPAGPGLGSPPACSPWEPGGEQHHCVPPRPVLLTWGCPAGEAQGCAARPGTALSNSTRAPVCVCVAAAASCLPPPCAGRDSLQHPWETGSSAAASAPGDGSSVLIPHARGGEAWGGQYRAPDPRPGQASGLVQPWPHPAPEVTGAELRGGITPNSLCLLINC